MNTTAVKQDRGPQSHFRFLELPKELRLRVYELLPREIKHDKSVVQYNPRQTGTDNLSESSIDNISKIKTMITFVVPVTYIAILCTCRQVYQEALKIIRQNIRDFVLDAPPRIVSGLEMVRANPVRALMVATARDYAKLRTMVEISGACLCPWDASCVCGWRDSERMPDYTTDTVALFTVIAKSGWEIPVPGIVNTNEEDTTPEGHTLLVRGDRSTSPVFVQLVDDNNIKTYRSFMKRTSLQLLYHHMKQLQNPSLSNPTIEYVRCRSLSSTCSNLQRLKELPLFSWDEGSWLDREHEEIRLCNYSIQLCLDSFLFLNKGSLTYEYGVDIGIAGHISTERPNQICRRSVPQLKPTGNHQARRQIMQSTIDKDIGRVVFLPTMNAEKWERDWVGP